MRIKPEQTFTEPVDDIIEVLSQAAKYAGSFHGIFVELKIEYLGIRVSARSIPHGHVRSEHYVGWKEFDGYTDPLGVLQTVIDDRVKSIRGDIRRGLKRPDQTRNGIS